MGKRMTITKEQIAELTKKYGSSETDTGCSAVQIAILTTRINSLTAHLKDHKKDNHSRRGLLAMVSKRRKLLDYIKERNPQQYLDLISSLQIRK